MEKVDLDNKLDKQAKASLKKLGEGLESLTKLADNSLLDMDKALKETMSKGQYGEYKAFLKKYLNLKDKGMHKEAEELKAQYGK